MSFLFWSLCFAALSECVVGVCFQERSRSCVKQMVVGDPSPSIPVYGNICSSILVSESLQLFFFSPPPLRRGVLLQFTTCL